MSEAILEMRGITKSFPGVKALSQVNLTLNKGEVLALIGENGAGKSTLMKILSGAYQADEGTIVLKGKEYKHYRPDEAIGNGISVIYQELNDLRSMSIAENIFVGHLPEKVKGVVDYQTLRKKSLDAQKAVGLDALDPFSNAGVLSVAQRQLIEIARSFMRGADIIVMDEPTAPLTDTEIEQLYRIIRNFTADGGAVILIAHKLNEVFEIADHVTVLRDGRNVMEKPTKELTQQELINAMVGREVKQIYEMAPRSMTKTMLEVSNLSNDTVQGISFDIKSGEIVALYGLMGAGCEEITASIYGVRPCTYDSIRLNGLPIHPRNPSDSLASGIAYVPSERKTDGLMLGMNITKNITLSTLRKYTKHGLMQTKEEARTATEWIEKLRIKTPSKETLTNTLSGGNQQKVVFAKAMNTEPKLLILNEPTRGVDVGARAEIYKLIESFCLQGVAVLMVSSDMQETMSIADRIAAVHEGKITAIFERGSYTQTELAQAVIGG